MVTVQGRGRSVGSTGVRLDGRVVLQASYAKAENVAAGAVLAM